VFGMMEAMLSFLRRQVGLRTDSADPDGSLHAKTKTINRAVWASGKSAVLTQSSDYSSKSAGTTTDLVRITGPRFILGGHIQLTAGNDSSNDRYRRTAYYLKVDGVNLISSHRNFLYDDLDQYFQKVNPFFDPSAAIAGEVIPIIRIPPIPVQTEFVFQFYNGDDLTNSPDAKWCIWHCAM
jgi:hypothetical protein